MTHTDKTDPVLGARVYEYLKSLGKESPFNEAERANSSWPSISRNTRRAYEDIIGAMMLDLHDDSIKDTPKRIGEMYENDLFWGLNYYFFPKCTTTSNSYNADEMIAIQGITVESMCEHHFLPFMGTATIAYIPNTKILGLSKFNRVVEFFSHRPQVQERLTEQIAATIAFILDCDDVAVVVRADHYCTRLRGVRDKCSSTITSKLLGRFRTVPELRQEFLSLTR